MKKITDSKSLFALLIFAACYLIFSHTPALAHRATIFAWIEGDTIHTQSKLSGGKRVKGGEVAVFDPDGAVLLKGKTDDNGMLSFTMPKTTGLKIVLNAAMGHRAEWFIAPEEMIASDGASITTETKKTVLPQKANDSKNDETNETSHIRPDIERCRDAIQKIVDDALERKLTPVLDKIAHAYDQGPGLTEVIGGIGYIIGLVGVALVVTSRRKKE